MAPPQTRPNRSHSTDCLPLANDGSATECFSTVYSIVALVISISNFESSVV